MHRQGHVGAALLAYAPLGAVLLALEAGQLALAGGAGAVLLAMLPDYDQRVPGLAHRGPTHTVWFALLVAVVCGGLGVIAAGPVAGVVAFLVGGLTVLSHLAADALTPAGIRPFAPVDDRHVSLDVVRSASTVGNLALLAVGAVAIAVAAGIGTAVSG